MHPAGGANAEVFAAGSNGLARSTNGGTAWTAVALPGAPANLTAWPWTFALEPCRGYVFGAGGPLIQIPAILTRRIKCLRPICGGAQLRVEHSLLSLYRRISSQRQAWYDWFVAAAPDSDRRVYLGAIEVYRGELGVAWTWTTISNKAGDDIHPDQHAIAFDPLDSNIVYVGNDGGLYRSPNRGTNWVALNRGLGITEIEYLAQDYGSSHWLIGGTQDNGSIRYRGSAVWDHAQDGDGGDCGVNRGSPNIVFHTFFGMGMERSTTKADWGSWAWIGPNVPANYSALFYPPMEANNSTVAQAGQTVYISRNNGTNWTDVA